MLNDRMRTSGAIVVSHSIPLLSRICTSAVVLENGRLEFFDTIEEGIARHEANMQHAQLH